MRKTLILILCVLVWTCSCLAEVNFENQEFSGDYGMAYHTLRGEQLENNTRGRLTSELNPYWNVGYSFRITKATALRLFGGVQLVRFQEPKTGTLKNENQVLNNFGLEFQRKSTPILKSSLFLMQQDHPLYFAKTPTEFEVFKRSFGKTGMHFSVGQRRRIGLIWGAGIKLFAMFPTKGGNLSTDAAGGGDAYLRLGWVGPFGTLYQLKGFYQVSSAPNAEVKFTHEILGSCLQISHSF